MVLRLNSHRARGVTLIELMVVIGVVAVLLSLAGPSIGNMVGTQRLRAAASDLHLALVKTRSEAVKRNIPVALNAAAGGWVGGWSVANPDGGTALVNMDAMNGVAIATSTPAFTSVIYNANGRRATAGEIWYLLSASSASTARCLYVDASGRPYAKEVAKETTTCP